MTRVIYTEREVHIILIILIKKFFGSFFRESLIKQFFNIVSRRFLNLISQFGVGMVNYQFAEGEWNLSKELSV